MDIYIIGKIIKEFRERKNISQEELAFDLCATSTLSRIESGKQSPNKKLAEALLSKLGISVSASNFQMSQIELKRWDLEQIIMEKIRCQNFDFKVQLEEYENLCEMDVLEKQQFLFFEAIFEWHHEYDKNLVLKKLESALKLTILNYKDGSLPENRLLTKNELIILNNIALLKHQNNLKDDAIFILEFLKRYYENNGVDENEKQLSVIIFNLSNWKGEKGLNQETLKLAEEGIRFSTKHGRLTYFPYHIFNKGWALGKLGDLDSARKNISLAFDILTTMGQKDEVAEYIPQVNKEFGFDFNL